MSEKWMKQQFRALESNAREKNLKMSTVCRLADMEPSMWFHWKAGRYSPNMLSFQRLYDAIERYRPKDRAAQ